MLSAEEFISGAWLPSPAVDLCAGYLEALRVLERQLHGATTVQVKGGLLPLEGGQRFGEWSQPAV